jgi:hypothetical protein
MQIKSNYFSGQKLKVYRRCKSAEESKIFRDSTRQYGEDFKEGTLKRNSNALKNVPDESRIHFSIQLPFIV